MRRAVTTILLLLSATLLAQAQTESNAVPPPKASASQPFASEADAVATIKDYLGRMDRSFETDSKEGYPILLFTEKMDHATHRVRIVIDMKRALVYVFLNRYLSLPTDNPHRDAVLRDLMKRNWDLNIGKFEWDPSDGEVRFSYCFTTENGIGYEAFHAIVRTLLESGDKYWPELKKMIDGQ
jgi:hypothetical protein